VSTPSDHLEHHPHQPRRLEPDDLHPRAREAAGIASLGHAVALLQLDPQWSERWHQEAVKQSGIFCYRGVVRRLFGAETA
jgi:hypothetical protein